MSGRSENAISASPYREEQLKPAILVLLVVLAVIILPLGWIIQQIGQKGFLASDTSRYAALAARMSQDAAAVRSLLQHEIIVKDVMDAAVPSPIVTLITPEVAPTNNEEALQQDPKKLELKLQAIYWNPRDPLVTIGNENYRTGEKVNGFTIEEIRKTEVVFRNPTGEKLIKYFYEEYL